MQLTPILRSSRVHTRLIDRIAYANDASYFRLVPQAVVQPDSIGEIQSLFQFSRQNRNPMTFRAAGTSLSGQAVTDGILVDISKYWDRYSLEQGAALVRTQPGLVGGFLNNVLKPHGRRLGPDPASMESCMVGGILANNSSGMCCGVTENSYRTIHSMTTMLTIARRAGRSLQTPPDAEGHCCGMPFGSKGYTAAYQCLSGDASSHPAQIPGLVCAWQVSHCDRHELLHVHLTHVQ